MASAPLPQTAEPTMLDIALEQALALFPEGRVGFRRTALDDKQDFRWAVEVFVAGGAIETGYDELPCVALDKAIVAWRAKYPNPEAVRAAEIERLRSRLATLEGVAK